MTGAPVVVVTGIAEAPMAAATIALQWDLPSAVVVQHSIDVGEQRLHRVVSDVTGTLDHTVIELQHACVTCAIREDVVPTLRQVSGDGRWDAVIAHLPVGAEASQLCRVSAHEGRAGAPIAGVIATLNGETLIDDLLGDDLLCERGLHSSDEDERGVGEVGAAMIEYADHIALSGKAVAKGKALVAALARPGISVLPDCSDLDAGTVLNQRRRHSSSESWVAEVRRAPIRTTPQQDVWTLDLRSSRPLHPDRLLEALECIGGGPRRSRGCFWLPSRPSEICGWQGAGGQLSVGSVGSWGLSKRLTRITVTGLDDGADNIRRAFEQCLLTPAEVNATGARWNVAEDGFEHWLGPITRVA
ncbi:MAG: GTP-binding protein [Ornithinimicrobium sp.]